MSDKIQNSVEYEEEHVHHVYEQIASHFSSTRYKPWPIIERFLQQLPPGSIGVDIGCGNGKYLAVNRDIFIVGSDRSTNLARIARQHKAHEAVVADALALPHQHGSMDFGISIAVVHHLSTPERRVEAMRSMLEVLRPSPPEWRSTDDRGGLGGGRALIYVWALEQKGSRRGWDEGDEQDVMVPWVMKGGSSSNSSSSSSQRQCGEGAARSEGAGTVAREQTFHRYYHLYRKGELERDIQAAGGEIVEAGYERDNWWAIARRRS